MRKKSISEILLTANQVLDVVDEVDQQGVIAHDEAAVGQLHSAINTVEELDRGLGYEDDELFNDMTSMLDDDDDEEYFDDEVEEEEVAAAPPPPPEPPPPPPPPPEPKPADFGSVTVAGQEKPKKLTEKEKTIRRRRMYMELINDQGYGGRIGKVYMSRTDFPMKEFKAMKHRSGLPKFDMVLAPDFSPIDGVHGVFISQKAVMSIVLAYPQAQNQWKVFESKPFRTPDEMLGLVMRMLTAPEKGLVR